VYRYNKSFYVVLQVHVQVFGVNGAELEVGVNSDGFLVDLTPPVMTEMADTRDGSRYQSDNNALNLRWNFEDWESGIKLYKVQILESYHGIKQTFWPITESYNVSYLLNPFDGKIQVSLGGLQMKNGHVYSLHVLALNQAHLSTTHETSGVIVDTTPPLKPKVCYNHLHFVSTIYQRLHRRPYCV